MKTPILAAAALAATLGFAATAQAQTYYYDQYGRVVSERRAAQDERRAVRAQQRAQRMAQADEARRIRDAQRQAQVLGYGGYYHGQSAYGAMACAGNANQPQFSSGSMVPCP